MNLQEKERLYRSHTGLNNYNTAIDSYKGWKLFVRPYFSNIGFTLCYAVHSPKGIFTGIDHKDIADQEYLDSLLVEEDVKKWLITNFIKSRDQLFKTYELLSRRWN